MDRCYWHVAYSMVCLLAWWLTVVFVGALCSCVEEWLLLVGCLVSGRVTGMRMHVGRVVCAHVHLPRLAAIKGWGVCNTPQPPCYFPHSTRASTFSSTLLPPYPEFIPPPPSSPLSSSPFLLQVCVRERDGERVVKESSWASTVERPPVPVRRWRALVVFLVVWWAPIVDLEAVRSSGGVVIAGGSCWWSPVARVGWPTVRKALCAFSRCTHRKSPLLA